MNTPAVIEHESPSQPLAPRSANPMDAQPAEFRQALARRGDNRKALIEWIRGALVDGTDYGAIQRRNGSMTKPSLRKPGAEKICGMLGVTATFPTLKDYEAAALDGREIHSIILRCHILSADGQIVADGVGARSADQDSGDLNKALKMALKSAHIDATLRMAGLSEIFTQDIEDMPPGTFDQNEGPAASASNSGSDRPPPRQVPRTNGGKGFATERQVKLIRVRLSQAGVSEAELCTEFGIEELPTLPFGKVNEALSWLGEPAR